MKKELSEKMNKFSVGLGLFDYINPIFYSITTFVIAKRMIEVEPSIISTIFIIGAIISLIFGFTIPTVKLLVGLGKFKFKMPVNLVFFVNTGILISGLSLFKYVLDVKIITLAIILFVILLLLGLIYFMKRKFNTIAVLTGAFGYILIYSSLIITAIESGIVFSIVCYVLAICFFLSLCGVGIKANLKDPKIHWILEISNVLCQGLVTFGTIFLLK